MLLYVNSIKSHKITVYECIYHIIIFGRRFLQMSAAMKQSWLFFHAFYIYFKNGLTNLMWTKKSTEYSKKLIKKKKKKGNL